jgi:hypothetical protein
MNFLKRLICTDDALSTVIRNIADRREVTFSEVLIELASRLDGTEDEDQTLMKLIELGLKD